ncbi:MAG: flap endonuclease, partial [Acidimicrobiales bacterium]
GQWDVAVRGAPRLAASLAGQRDLAYLFRRLATLEIDRALLGSVDDLRWTGPAPGFDDVARALGAPGLADRAKALARTRGC